ncbi:uncharacterized protein B0I36DRAFT_360015 [Microdochium trichocladiopsis]|uniref:Uncharacterized protein n=1 Tax=Microdochium trichocladiopsis TaxID=1682393 RepID=A0A9P8YCV6_9PEZI|nr:uncharacterized protein B0I36DRAFT_360015 [Microdochium trichocladiopsis]KAH7034497.1 hypothetical protein B0I36DRAFT_360015 [Microdochium trichocladiopsis]
MSSPLLDESSALAVGVTIFTIAIAVLSWKAVQANTQDSAATARRAWRIRDTETRELPAQEELDELDKNMPSLEELKAQLAEMEANTPEAREKETIRKAIELAQENEATAVATLAYLRENRERLEHVQASLGRRSGREELVNTVIIVGLYLSFELV